MIISGRPHIGRLTVAIMVAVATLYGAEARAAEFRLMPSFALSGEFNDNIDETAFNRRSDFITRVQPGAIVHYDGLRSNADLAYGLDYRHFSYSGQQDGLDHNLALRGMLELKRNFCFVEVSDNYSLVSLDLARDTRAESTFVNQTDQNVLTVSPFLVWRIASRGTLKTGYRYIDTRYWSTQGVDKHEQTVFADLSYDLAPRLGLTAGYLYSDVSAEPTGYQKHDLFAGIKYEYASNSFIYGTVGNSWQSFSGSNDSSDPFWSAGISRDFGTVTGTVETRVQYAEDPLTLSTQETTYSATLSRVAPESSLGLAAAYSEFVLTQTGVTDRRQTSLTATGERHLSPRLSVNMILNGDRTSQKSNDDYPYRLVATGGLSYSLNHDMILTLTYSFITYRRALDNADQARDVNRGIIELRKSF